MAESVGIRLQHHRFLSVDDLKNDENSKNQIGILIAIILSSVFCCLGLILVIKKTFYVIKIKVDEKILDYTSKLDHKQTTKFAFVNDENQDSDRQGINFEKGKRFVDLESELHMLRNQERQVALQQHHKSLAESGYVKDPTETKISIKQGTKVERQRQKSITPVSARKLLGEFIE